MNKAQLLAGAEIQQVGQNPRSLRTGRVLKVLSDLGKEEVFVVGGIAPVGLAVGRSRRCRWGWRIGRRARQLLIKVGGGRGHVWRRRPSELALLLRQLLDSLVQQRVVGIERQLLAEQTPPPLGKAHGSFVASHGVNVYIRGVVASRMLSFEVASRRSLDAGESESISHEFGSGGRGKQGLGGCLARDEADNGAE